MKSIFTLILAISGFLFIAGTSPLSASPSSSEFGQFRTNLYIIAADGTNVLIDGTLTQYDTGYSNNVDGMDARKMSNPAENFGMLRNNTSLIIERRHTIQGNDSIFFKMWNIRTFTYRLDLVAYNLNTPGRIGVLKDKYLQTETPLNLDDTSRINFSVNADPKSYASDRFMVIFLTPGFATLPLTFTSVKAFQQDNAVNIDWTTANETSIKQYDIEKSVTGNNFIKITGINAGNTAINNYQSADVNPAEGYNYYRIRAISIDGKINYSDVVKLYFGKGNQRINIYPNPATVNNLNLQMISQPEGIYEVRLMNSFGQKFMTKTIQYKGGSSTENISPGKNIPKGIYQLEIKTPAGERKVISLVF